MEEYSAQEIIRGLKHRDRKVARFVTDEYLPMIVYMVEWMGGNRQDAEDVFQETLYIIISKIDKGELLQLTAKFSTYLYSISKKIWMNQLYEKNREKEYMYIYLNKVYYQSFEADRLKALREKQFWYYYKQLSDVCRKILELYFSQQSIKMIADDLGNTEKYIKKRKYECKKRFIKLILENIDKI